MLFDTHCHLDVDAFDEDRDIVIDRAHAASVGLFVNPACDMASSKRAISLARERDDIYAAVGVHPNDLGGLNAASLSELQTLAGAKRVVAIGEIGLDYHWNTFPRDAQIRGFKQQLELAVGLHLPVIIHCRDAYEDLLEILEGANPGCKILLHSFAGTPRQAIRALAFGCYLGIGGPVTFKNATMLRSVVREAPLERLVLETDAPYLAPHPFRGKRNEPSYIKLTAAIVAELCALSVEQIAEKTTATASRFFGLT